MDVGDCHFHKKYLPLCHFWFRSSVGLEQRPSKAWVQGSNPCGITFIPNE